MFLRDVARATLKVTPPTYGIASVVANKVAFSIINTKIATYLTEVQAQIFVSPPLATGVWQGCSRKVSTPHALSPERVLLLTYLLL